MTCYASVNFKTKKALKEAVDAHNRIRVRELTPMGDRVPVDGEVVISGPHYPQPHKWYCKCQVKEGVIISTGK